MFVKLFFKAVTSVLLLTLFNMSAIAAPPACKKNDPDYPDCLNPPPPPPPPAAIVVNSVEVDWPNEQFIVRGEGLDIAPQVSLAGSIVSSTDSNTDGSEMYIPFDNSVASTVTDMGNYQLNINGSDVISVFIKSQIISADAQDCPCELPWSTALQGLQKSPECIAITGDSPQIAGTIYSDTSSSYPQYAIGAAFIRDKPNDTVCSLVQVNENALINELVNIRINKTQQGSCAATLASSYCSVVTEIP